MKLTGRKLTKFLHNVNWSLPFNYTKSASPSFYPLWNAIVHRMTANFADLAPKSVVVATFLDRSENEGQIMICHSWNLVKIDPLGIEIIVSKVPFTGTNKYRLHTKRKLINRSKMYSPPRAGRPGGLKPKNDWRNLFSTATFRKQTSLSSIQPCWQLRTYFIGIS